MVKDLRYISALITGSSSGIGTAFARALPQETNLVLTGRNAARLDLIAAELGSPGRRIETIPADLTLPEGRRIVIEAAQRSSIDLLVCNAGLGTAGNFSTTPEAAEHDTIAVNVVAVTELLHALIPSMLALAKHQNRRCGIIVVSSGAAFGPLPGLASYGASKAFELRLTESIAAELKNEPIDVLAVCPTYTETEFFERAGMPTPAWWAPAESVPTQAMATLGNKSVLICPGPQNAVDLFLAPWRSARRIAGRTVRRLISGGLIGLITLINDYGIYDLSDFIWSFTLANSP